jgi:putative inorganic carbon (hco3(-)) transporter
MLSPAQPFVYLLAYLCVLYIRPHEFLPVFKGVPLQPVLLAVAFLFWLTRQPKSCSAPQFYLVPLLAFMMSFSVLLTGWMGGALITLEDFLPVVLLFFMIATSLDSVGKFRATFFVLTASATFMAFHGIKQVQTIVGFTGAETIEGRITYLGFLGDPNDLSMFFLMTLPLCMYLAQSSKSLLLRYLYLIGAGTILYGVYLSGSRGAFLGLATMLAFYFYRRYGITKSMMLIPMVLIILAALAPGRMLNISSDEESAAGRVEAWGAGIEMLKSSPLFGVGKGNFTDHHNLTAHNSFVWFANVGLTLLMNWKVAHFAADNPSAETAIFPINSTRTRLGRTSPTKTSTTLSHSDADKIANALLYASIGGIVCTLFLSRSYTPLLYAHFALIVGCSINKLDRKHLPPAVTWKDNATLLFKMCVASVLIIWLAVKFLS